MQPKTINGGQHKDVTHPTGELILQGNGGQQKILQPKNGGQHKDVTHPTEEFCRGMVDNKRFCSPKMVGNIKTLPTLQEN
ncbi:MAG TPA: hypothetical protein ENF37_05930 [Beggiatoa sp.]|nr:hypothetical protein [Beggiatoa sp.]